MRDLTHQVGRATSDLAQGSRQIIQAVESTTDQVLVIVEATKEQEQGSHRIVDSIERISASPARPPALPRSWPGRPAIWLGRPAGSARPSAPTGPRSGTGGTALVFCVIPSTGRTS